MYIINFKAKGGDCGPGRLKVVVLTLGKRHEQTNSGTVQVQNGNWYKAQRNNKLIL